MLIYNLFRNIRDFSFVDQIKRAVVSIGNNIAEGFKRKSNQELKYFLYIDKGSCGEVRSMSYLAIEFKYISKKDSDKINNLSMEISKLLSGFINFMTL